jgi:hypothetical protein
MNRVLQRVLARLSPADWVRWPERAYRNESYRSRLRTVQDHVAECIDAVDSGSVQIISICAGDGRDVIDVVRSHRRRDDVRACLIELDEGSVAAGRKRASSAGLQQQVTFVAGDATDLASYQGHVPCDIAIVCGVWGHVPPAERENLVVGLASILRPGGLVVWTRGVGEDLSRANEIRMHFNAPTWEESRMTVTPDGQWAVVTERYRGGAAVVPANGRMFEFRADAG